MNCPCCGGELKVIGSRARVYINEAGDKCKVSIRRLRCKGCGRIHHELPDILVPYKRHCVKTVERIVNDGDDSAVSACCENSTVKRIGRWFEAHAGYFLGYVERTAANLKIAVASVARSKLRRVRAILGDRRGWLASLVRAVVNENLRPHTRSAYCPG